MSRHDARQHGVITRLSTKLQNDDQGIALQDPIKNDNVTTERYTIHKLVENEPQLNWKIIYRVTWYAYKSKADSWEPTHQLPRTKILQYFKLNTLPLPPDIDLAEV